MTKSTIKVRDVSSLSQIVADKNQDLESLANISRLIDQLQMPQSEADRDQSMFLLQIGKEAQKIKFKDSSTDYIRNKYGLFDRNNHNAFRPHGLEINHLEALQQVYDVVEHVSSWQDSLKIIQRKIDLIIEAEKEPASKTTAQVLESFAKMKKPQKFLSEVSNGYVGKISQKLREMTADDRLTDLDFSKKEERYYFANSLLKTGELCREVIDFVNPAQDSGLFGFFKKIRNDLAHNINVMSDNIDTTQRNNLGEIREKLVLELPLALDNVVRFKKFDALDQDTKNHHNYLIRSITNKTASKKKSSATPDIAGHLTRSIKEINYLKSVSENEAYDQEYKNAILDFGTTKIVQSFNKIDAMHDSHLTEFMQGAHVLQESWLETIKIRNRRIAHGILRFDDDGSDAMQGFTNFVATMASDLNSLLDVFHFAKSNCDIGAQAANSFLDRNYLLSIAKSHAKIGSTQEAVAILEECLQAYEHEVPLIHISKDSTLFDIVRHQALHYEFFADLLQEGYFALSKTDGFYELRGFLNEAVARSFENNAFQRQIEQGVPVIAAIDNLPAQEALQVRLLLAVPYFATQHQILSELSSIYYDKEEKLVPLLDKKSTLEENIYGHVLQLTMVEKSYLLGLQGKMDDAQAMTMKAHEMESDLPVVKIETLLNAAKLLAKQSDLVSARQQIALAQTIADCDYKLQPVTFSQIAEFEAQEGNNIEGAMLYLHKAAASLDNKAQLRSLGNIVLMMEKKFVQAGIDVMSRYVLQMREEMPQENLDLLHYVSESALNIHSHTQDKKDYWRQYMGKLNTVLNAAAILYVHKPDVRSDLIEKSYVLDECYQTRANPHHNMFTSLNLYADIALKFQETVESLKKKDVKKMPKALDALLDNMIKFGQSKGDEQPEIPEKITEFLEKYFIRFLSKEEPERSMHLVDKYGQFKTTYHLPQTKTDLFLQASCKFNLTQNTQENAQQAILLAKKAKSLPTVAGGVDDYVLDDFCGLVYTDIGQFSNAIRAYQSAKNNAKNPQQEHEAQESIDHILQAFKANRTKNVQQKGALASR